MFTGFFFVDFVLLLLGIWVLSGLLNSCLWTGNPFASEEESIENIKTIIDLFFDKDHSDKE